MCDLNGHINNSLYLDIACDALPQEVVEAAPLSFASIKYHREVPMGQSVQVFYAPSGNGWYLLGRREEQNLKGCVIAQVVSRIKRQKYKNENFCFFIDLFLFL
mgnify:CR=1 FL=1